MSKWRVDYADSRIGFSIRHLMLSKVRGRFSKWTADLDLDEERPDASQIRASIDAASIDTGDPARDEHLRERVLMVRDHPRISYEGTRVRQVSRRRFEVGGMLTVAGTSRPVLLDVEYARDRDLQSQRVALIARGHIDRKEFGVEWNAAIEFGGVLVGDRIEVLIELELLRPVPGA